MEQEAEDILKYNYETKAGRDIQTGVTGEVKWEWFYFHAAANTLKRKFIYVFDTLWLLSLRGNIP